MFLKIDLKSKYHQVRIKEEHVHKTTFKTKYGHYEFTMASFGLSNALATFMCLVNSFFKKDFDKFVLVFLDDILVYSRNEEEHEEHLKTVLQVLKEHQFHAKLSKCEFYQRRI